MAYLHPRPTSIYLPTIRLLAFDRCSAIAIAAAADKVQSVLASSMQNTFEIKHNKQCPVTCGQEPVHAL